MKIVIGIVLYKNTKEQILKILNSIMVQTISAEVKVSCWNNCGSDYSWLAQHSGVHLSPYSSNLGFGSAHNKMMSHCNQWEFYLALNPDGILHHNALCRLSESAKGLCLVEAKQVPHEHPKHYDPETKFTDWCSGACLLIPRQTAIETGAFADDFFMYCEDVDLSWRVRSLGGKCIVSDTAYFYHDVESNEHRPQLAERMYQSQLILAKRWGNEKIQKKALKKLRKIGIDKEAIKMIRNKIDKVKKLEVETNVSNFTEGFVFSSRRW